MDDDLIQEGLEHDDMVDAPVASPEDSLTLALIIFTAVSLLIGSSLIVYKLFNVYSVMEPTKKSAKK